MKGSRFKLNQNHAPIHEALETFRRMRVVPFDVPGHKRGRGNPELTEFLGQKCVGVDVNSMKPLDNLCHPVSVIREAEELAADAFGAAHAFLMVGGTTSSVQTMVLTACKRGDEIILPRNVHRSVFECTCFMRCDSCLCKPGGGSAARNFPWNEKGTSGESNKRTSKGSCSTGKQSDLLWNMQ